MLVFTYETKFNLLDHLQSLPIPNAGNWLNDVASNTDQAIHLLLQHTPLNKEMVILLFRQAFLSGYAGTLWLLVLVELIGLGIVLYYAKDRPKFC